MYIRWKLRERRGTVRNRNNTHSLCAILVAAERVNGRPTQRFVRHLGNIRSLDSAMARKRFWEQVERELSALGEDVDHYREAITRRVPCPTTEEFATEQAQFEQWCATLRAMTAGMGRPRREPSSDHGTAAAAKTVGTTAAAVRTDAHRADALGVSIEKVMQWRREAGHGT